jgi:predicted S18 family serine protease
MGKLAKFTLVLLLLVLPIASKEASMPVPAVVMLGGGELVQLEVEIRQGRGDVYVATDPLVGIQTQDSAKTAFKVAGKLTGADMSKYDALVRLNVYGGAKSVDGPSGGAAMTLLMLSILENKTLRSDLTATGTIQADGSIGEVGEVGKKTRAAVLSGMRVILIPKNYDVFDKMVFSILGRRWNISIIEVDDIKTAEELAFTPENTTMQSNVMEVKPSTRLNLSETELNCSDCYIPEFKEFASKIIENNRALLDEVRKQNKSEFTYFLDMIESNLEGAEDAEKWNYPYTGANSAFLVGINLNFLNGSNITSSALQNRMASVESCIDSAIKPQMTEENFEWVAGGDERLFWAEKKLEEIKKQNYSSDDDETILFLFKELLTSESWCQVSHEMFSLASKINGTPVNESNLKRFASSKIADATEKLNSFVGADFGDAGWRFEAAKNEFGNGSFVAATFDSEYLLSAVKTMNETDDMNGFLEKQFATPKSWSGMWAALYGNHAQYIYLRSKVSGGMESAVLLRIYANSLNNDTIKIKELFESPAVESENTINITVTGEQPTQYDNSLALLLVMCLILAIFLNVVQIFRTAE